MEDYLETVRRAGKPVSGERIDGGDSGWTA